MYGQNVPHSKPVKLGKFCANIGKNDNFEGDEKWHQIHTL